MSDTIYTHCLHCNKELITKKQKKYCSRICGGKATKFVKPFIGPKYFGRCFHCNQILFKKTQNKYCSQICHTKSVTKIRKKINCKYCNSEFSENKNKNKIFCSKKCSGTFNRKQNIQKIENGISFSTDKMKQYLIEKNGNQCELCKTSNWMNNPLTLHCHHIDGNKHNNHLSNLQILCPNCHTQTDNYGSKNR